MTRTENSLLEQTAALHDKLIVASHKQQKEGTYIINNVYFEKLKNY